MEENKITNDAQQTSQNVVYVCPYNKKPPAHGLGVAGLNLGIIGLLWAVIAYFYSVGLYYFEDALQFLMVGGIPSVLAIIFGATAKSKNNQTGVATSGMVLGIIATSMMVLALIANLQI